MKVKFGTVYRDTKTNNLTWYLSFPINEAIGFGDKVAIIPDYAIGVFKFTFDSAGHKLSSSKTAKNYAVSFPNKALGKPVQKRMWEIEAKQVSTNPVSFLFPLPKDLLSVLTQPDYNQPTVSTHDNADIRVAIELLNEHLQSNSTLKAYIKDNGLVGVKRIIEEEI